MDQGPSASPLGRLNQPPLDDGPDIKLEAPGHGIEKDCLVLRDCAKVQGRLDFYAQKIVPNLSHRCEGVHLKIGKVTRRWLAFLDSLALGELLHQALIIRVCK